MFVNFLIPECSKVIKQNRLQITGATNLSLKIFFGSETAKHGTVTTLWENNEQPILAQNLTKQSCKCW